MKYYHLPPGITTNNVRIHIHHHTFTSRQCFFSTIFTTIISVIAFRNKLQRPRIESTRSLQHAMMFWLSSATWTQLLCARHVDKMLADLDVTWCHVCQRDQRLCEGNPVSSTETCWDKDSLRPMVCWICWTCWAIFMCGLCSNQYWCGPRASGTAKFAQAIVEYVKKLERN